MKEKRRPPLRIAVLISGTGTGLQNLAARIADGRLTGVEIVVVIASRPDAPGIERAEAAGLPVDVIPVRDFPDEQKFSEQIDLTLEVYDVNLVVMAGWLCFWRMPRRWMGKTINIHPSLLPKYGGKGFYGHRVHEAVLAAGETQSGATVHWADNEYDHGEIILQRACDVRSEDTAETLAARVREIEFELLPEAIARIRDGSAKRPRN